MIQVLQRKSIKKSRKLHRCSYCIDLINIGESYELLKIKYGIEYYEVKAHTYCNKVNQELVSSGYFVDDGIGMTADYYKDSVTQLYRQFVSSKDGYNVQTMSMDLSQIFEESKLIAYRPQGYTESWTLQDRKE